MKLMGKDFQKIETIYAAADKLSAVGIRPSFNMIFGYPGEGEPERRESIALIMDICRRYPGAEFWTNIFTPYPGAPIMQRAFELGIDVPKTLEGWVDFCAITCASLFCVYRSASSRRIRCRGLCTEPLAYRRVGGSTTTSINSRSNSG
jgi:hypothetical protein